MSKPDRASKMLPITSSAFDAFHYDAASRALTVTFKGGATWQYDGVPAERAEAFAGNASPGSFFAAKIKGQYAGRKL